MCKHEAALQWTSIKLKESVCSAEYIYKMQNPSEINLVTLSHYLALLLQFVCIKSGLTGLGEGNSGKAWIK